MFKQGFWIFGLTFLLGFVSSTEQERLPSVIFETKLLKCAMYSKSCYLNVLMKSANSTEVETSNTRISRYLSIHLCMDTEKFKCPSKQVFEEQLNNQTIDESYQVYSIHLYPALFGQSNLVISSKEDQNSSYSAIILVTQPRRWIDYLFDIWVYVFQTIISMIMGILINLDTLLMIKKLYKPVIMGEYLFSFKWIMSFLNSLRLHEYFSIDKKVYVLNTLWSLL